MNIFKPATVYSLKCILRKQIIVAGSSTECRYVTFVRKLLKFSHGMGVVRTYSSMMNQHLRLRRNVVLLVAGGGVMTAVGAAVVTYTSQCGHVVGVTAASATSNIAGITGGVHVSHSAQSEGILRHCVEWVRFHAVVLVRVAVLCLLALPLALLYYPLTRAGGDLWWRMLLYVMNMCAGPTFLKLGQWAATRRDMFPPQLCDTLSALHTRVAPHHWAHTERALRDAFGPQWRELVVYIDPKPVGSGCVAQVYKAHVPRSRVEDFSKNTISGNLDAATAAYDLTSHNLEYQSSVILGFHNLFNKKHTGDKSKNTGEVIKHAGDKGEHTRDKNNNDPTYHREDLIPVAVKVLHPGVRRRVEEDVWILDRLARLLTAGCPATRWLQLPECVDEFAARVRAQTDLTVEARALERFSQNFDLQPSSVKGKRRKKKASSSQNEIRFPTPIRPLVTPDVLVETWQEGVPLSGVITGDIILGCDDDDDDVTNATIYRHIADAGLHAILKMIFRDNFVHADLHPGNILVHAPPPPTTGTSDICKICGVDGGVGLGGNSSRRDQLMLVDMCDIVVVGVSAAGGRRSDDVISSRGEEGGGGGNLAHNRGTSNQCNHDNRQMTSSRPPKPGLIFLDAGITATLAPLDYKNLRAVFSAVIKGDGRRVGELMLRHSPGGHMCEAPEAFCEDMGRIVGGALGRSHGGDGGAANLANVNVSELLSSVFTCLMRHRVRVESGFATVILALMVVEGLGRSLDPQLDFVQLATPYLLDHLY